MLARFLNLFFLKNSCPDAVSYVHIGMCSCCSSCQIFASLWSIRPSWLHEMILPSLVSFPVLHFFGMPSGSVRDASPVPVPCATHIHPPRDFPPSRPRSPLFLHSFTDILSSFIQNRAYSQKSFPKVLPVT